jgi:hypothetical protein
VSTLAQRFVNAINTLFIGVFADRLALLASSRLPA